jgi:hypothetical protein
MYLGPPNTTLINLFIIRKVIKKILVLEAEPNEKAVSIGLVIMK